MSSGKIYAILFYSNDDLVLHFESITSEWLSMANFDEWNPKLIQFINQKQSYEFSLKLHTSKIRQATFDGGIFSIDFFYKIAYKIVFDAIFK